MSARKHLTDEEFGDLLSVIFECERFPDDIAHNDLVRLVDRLVGEHKAQAWDEGYRLDWTGGVHWGNPYRAEGDA